jgi:hypothetical protein
MITYLGPEDLQAVLALASQVEGPCVRHSLR